MDDKEKVEKFRKTKKGKLALRYYHELGATPIQAAKFAAACGRKGKRGRTFGMRRNIVGECPNTTEKLTTILLNGKEV
jgi:hypothetical protein